MSVRLGFVCIAQDDYEPALSLATTAQELTKLAKKTALESEANFLSDEIARCSPAFDRIKNWAIRLSKSPDSTHANAACRRYLCFVKNAWSKDLPMLQKSKEAKWVDVATHELARPTLPFDQINLGNRWRDLASSGSVQQRHDLLLRANYWYAKALYTLEKSARPFERSVALAIASAEERGAEFFQEFPPSKATLAITISVEGGASLVIDAEQICLSGNSHGARNITVNHQLWGTFSPGAQQFRPNTGSTRFLPDGLDFSKATLSKRRISNRWGGQGAALPEFAAGSDRIRLGFLDHYDGAADFDLVISF